MRMTRTERTRQAAIADGGVSATWYEEEDLSDPGPETGAGVGGVVLAAGEGRRFDGPYKLLERVEGEPMIRRAVRPFLESCLDNVVVVVGHREADVREVLSDLAVEIVTNPEYEAGQSTSLRRGVTRAQESDWDATVFGLGDMPFVRAETVDLLVQGYLAGFGGIVGPAHDGERGNPTLFVSEYYDELAAVTGDVGGRPVMLESDDVAIVETGDPGVLQDVDVREDL